MMSVELSDKILSVLSNFTHSARTNFEKKTLTNHDATCFIFYMAGVCKVGEVTDILRKWRGNETMTFGYLFNKSKFGGYGFVAESYSQLHNDMTLHGHEPPRFWGHVMTGKARVCSDPQLPIYDREVGFKRRTYWERLRAGRGLYSPTFACSQRMAELKQFFF